MNYTIDFEKCNCWVSCRLLSAELPSEPVVAFFFVFMFIRRFKSAYKSIWIKNILNLNLINIRCQDNFDTELVVVTVTTNRAFLIHFVHPVSHPSDYSLQLPFFEYDVKSLLGFCYSLQTKVQNYFTLYTHTN